MNKYFRSKINSLWSTDSELSKITRKNIIQSFVLKVLSIILSLMIVPLTIGYVNAEQYGVWLTVSSIVGWIGYFDLGLGHGLRNRYAEAKAQKNYQLASKLLSTAYAILFLIFAVIFIIFCILNHFVDWCAFLHITQVDNSLLQKMMIMLVGFFCLNMVLGVLKSLLLGDLKTALSSSIGVVDQILSLILIYFLSHTAKSSLLYLVFVYSGVPCLVLLITSLIFYLPSKGLFNKIKPSFSKIEFKLSKDILSLGVKFFIIQISLVLIFQCVNVIISRNCGQLSVTQYNLSYKYFQVLYMVCTIILTPYWTAFTDAYARHDIVWMKSTFARLTKFSFMAIPCLVLMEVFAPLFFTVWVGKDISIPFMLNICMGFFIFSQILSALHTYILNGLGIIRLQLIIYISFSALAIPILDLFSKSFGVLGILVFLSVVYLTQALIGRIQVSKILENTATGIWKK